MKDGIAQRAERWAQKLDQQTNGDLSNLLFDLADAIEQREAAISNRDDIIANYRLHERRFISEIKQRDKEIERLRGELRRYQTWVENVSIAKAALSNSIKHPPHDVGSDKTNQGEDG